MSAFADPDIIRMCQDDFIPVAGDDWYQRRRQDKEGDFLRTLAAAAGRRGENGTTLQHIYLFTADGTLLGAKNAGQDVPFMKNLMRQSLASFDRLPEAKRKPGAVTVEDRGRPDPNYSRTPPAGGLIVKEYTRILDFKDGAYCKGNCQALGGEKAARDHLWITADELKALAPAKAEVGFRYPLPEKIANRIARFHLVDNTRGEPSPWTGEQIRARRFTLRVIAVTADGVEVRLEGEAVLATAAELPKADRGYEVRLLGTLRWVPAKGTFDRFDVVALGAHWGEHSHNAPARPGKSLIGHVFELATDKPGDKTPPQGIRDIGAYYGRE